MPFLMSAYVCGKDLLDENGEFAGVIPVDDLAELSEPALDNLLAAGREMIDAYCQKSFSEEKEIPYIFNIFSKMWITVRLKMG